jgi:hypothetical protein
MKIVLEHSKMMQEPQLITLFIVSRNWHRRGETICFMTREELASSFTTTLKKAENLQSFWEEKTGKPQFIYSADFTFPSPDELMEWLIENRDAEDNTISDLFDQNVVITSRWDPSEPQFAEDTNAEQK